MIETSRMSEFPDEAVGVLDSDLRGIQFRQVHVGVPAARSAASVAVMRLMVRFEGTRDENMAAVVILRGR